MHNNGTSIAEYALVVCLMLASIVSIGLLAGYFWRNHVQIDILADANQKQSPVNPIDTSPRQQPTTRPKPEPENQKYLLLVVLCVSQGALVIGLTVLLYRMSGRKVATNALKLPPGASFESILVSMAIKLRKRNESDLSWEPLVRDFMCAKPSTVLQKATFQEVQQQFEASVHHTLFVVDDTSQILGMITNHEMKARRPADQLMVKPLHVFEATTPLSKAIRDMLKEGPTIAAVVEQGMLVGIISHVELMLGLTAALQVTREVHTRYNEKMLHALRQ